MKSAHSYTWAHGHGRFQGILQSQHGGTATAFAPPGKRYCETCGMHKLKHGVAMKGWKCLECTKCA